MRGITLVCFLLFSSVASAYSVLTHEQLIDLAWNEFIRPLLISRYPQTSAAELQEAHAYAYGGCAIQDMGYYPFGHKFFSDVTHYVRTGDFIMRLLADARTRDEYAFALGALSHYIGDNIGHHDAINRATALSFPKLAKKFGPIVTYDENPHAHIRTEFAFDIDQLSKHRLAPSAYLRFIGLRVSRRVLEQAFTETYSLHLREVLGPEMPAIRSYRTSVRSFIPRFAHAESLIHKDDFPDDPTGREFELYLKRLNETEFQKVWSRYRRQPGFVTHVIAILIRILPKIGPLSVLAIAIPTGQTDGMYITSVNRSIELYSTLLGQFRNEPKAIPPIPNRDLDTGEVSKPGAYKLTDKTYAEWLHRLTADPSRTLSGELKRDLQNYFAAANVPARTRQITSDLATLEKMPVSGP